MNLQKLTYILSNKQLYNETNLYMLQILNDNKTIIQLSVKAVKQILTKSQQYSLLTKLYAIRYLKQIFECGNKNLIKLIESQLLNELKIICIDSKDITNNYKKYLDRDIRNSEEMKKFKSELLSFFTLTLECVRNWSDWMSKYQSMNNAFTKLVKDLKAIGIILKEENKYFKLENKKTFEERYNKRQQQNKTQNLNLDKNDNKNDNEKSQKIKLQNAKQFDHNLQKLSQQLESIFQSKSLTSDQLKNKYQIISNKFQQQIKQYNLDQKKLIEYRNKFREIQIKIENRIQQQNNKSQLQRPKKVEFTVVVEQQKSIEKSESEKFLENETLKILNEPKIPESNKSLNLQNLPRVEYIKTQSYSEIQELKKLSINNIKTPSINLHLDPKTRNVLGPPNAPIQQSSNQYNSRVIALEQKIKQLTNERTDLLKTINHRVKNKSKYYEQLNTLTKQLMTEKRQRFKLTEQLMSLQSQYSSKMSSRSKNKLTSEQSSQYADSEYYTGIKTNSYNKKEQFSNTENNRKKSQVYSVRKAPRQTKTENGHQFTSIKRIQEIQLQQLLTHNSMNRSLLQKILNEHNLRLLKSVMLSKNDDVTDTEYIKLYQDQFIEIYSNIKLEIIENIQFVNIKLKFIILIADDFQDSNQYISDPFFTNYQSVKQFQIWKRPIQKISDYEFRQSIMVQIQQLPLSIVECHCRYMQIFNVRFVLPILFYSFLQIGQLNKEKFKYTLRTEEKHILKSKILKLNPQFVTSFSDLELYFTIFHKHVDKSVNKWIYYIALLYSQSNSIFLVSIEVLANQRVMFRVLGMQCTSKNKQYAKQLLDNLIFLLTL